MLSDEEKKAIEGLFHLVHINTYLDLEKEDVVKISRTLIDQWRDKTDTLLNLIEKQSKEIEELKQDRDEYKEEYIKLQNARYYNYISKDKIKAKIEEEDKLFFKTKDVRHANRYKAYKELLEKE